VDEIKIKHQGQHHNLKVTPEIKNVFDNNQMLKVPQIGCNTSQRNVNKG
jgi:hypothetical protein